MFFGVLFLIVFGVSVLVLLKYEEQRVCFLNVCVLCVSLVLG